ncbi:MAG: UDP-3-O-acyl-N-acetylglucosamine deacetylase [Bacteroidales bacterium]|jgi:UDP-3-O-[3-hydroxymyristoyl] N-acetylglucosamine deacetylase/3-hydroxyacyl-[acyl-carrier-protein] dehydratase|nr:UDP-3-O-acyl-N-acetylglucosamine deacetylase [Bacteroidales bacterium]MCI1785156.1 UDP-3-O-acyl-N-acetylglucosamine deacetylase [Bacteroidales bacterium]
MSISLQQTLKKQYEFEGKGLHTGKIGKVIIKPAEEDSGIRFRRTDLGESAIVHALAENVSSTSRSTTISEDGVSVATIEHIMSALTGMGVDNALIDIDNVEVPILDGSARFYSEAIAKDGLEMQSSARKYLELSDSVEVKDENSGAYLKIEPADSPLYDLTVDFNSKVLGIQKAEWNMSMDYLKEIASCRTFVFFHEIEYLFSNNLIKGGDVDNSIVIVEHPVKEEQLAHLSKLFGIPKLEINEKGYLNNLELYFPNECGRHKLLDLIGDMRLCGGYLNAKITAFKPGHTINTNAAKAVRKLLK